MTLMETAQLLGNFGEFVGAFAVVGTLVYLALQVKQSKESMDAHTNALDENSKLTRAEVVRQVAYHWEEISHRVAQNRETASVFVRGSKNLSDLDEVDQLIYGDQMSAFLTHQVSTVRMATDGFLEKPFADLIDEVVVEMLRQHPGARTWWEATQHNWPHGDHVNALIRRDSVVGSIKAFGAPLVQQPVEE